VRLGAVSVHPILQFSQAIVECSEAFQDVHISIVTGTQEEMLHRADLDDRHNAARLQILEARDEARWGRKNRLDGTIKTPSMHPGAVALARKSSGRNDAA